MSLGKTLLACFTCSAALLGVSADAETLKGCKEPKGGTKEAPIFSPPLADVVTGAGRLQFYSAPDFRCPMDEVFVVAKDRLIAYAQTDDGWSSVMYATPRTGNSVTGWVRSTRLKETGAVGPEQ
jgi:hypothetical protein